MYFSPPNFNPGEKALYSSSFCKAPCHELCVCCRIITEIHIFMPIPLLSAANLSAGEKRERILFPLLPEADRSRKRQAWRWVCVSLWPIKGYCSVLSTGDSLYCHRPLWQALFICVRSAGGPALGPGATG